MSARDDVLEQIPATLWTTDRALVITGVSGADVVGLGPFVDDLVGRSVRRLLDEDEDHPILRAHLGALDGRPTPLRVDWGERTFVGRVSPYRDPVGRVIGCIGVALPEAALGADTAGVASSPSGEALDITSPASVSQRLADICVAIPWDRAVLWSAGESHLTVLGVHRATTDDERQLEPFAWLTTETGEPQWVSQPGGWLTPLAADGSVRAVLALIRDSGLPPDELERGDIAASATPLADALAAADPFRWWPLTYFRVVATPMRLAACLGPLPFFFTAC